MTTDTLISPMPPQQLVQQVLAPELQQVVWTTLPAGVSLDEEVDDLVALLLEHATYPGVLAHHLAHALAVASMGPNHLWEDLGLGSRDQLNALMQEHFTTMKALNANNMRWKKFFYRSLCERAEVLICKSPHCEQCEDKPQCFE